KPSRASGTAFPKPPASPRYISTMRCKSDIAAERIVAAILHFPFSIFHFPFFDFLRFFRYDK
ncbi:MAG: hypothetical protein ACRD5G_08800, partial [Candidatus Acidiferrales bacterium]